MDVYFAMTNYHILSALLHKLFYNEKNSVIYVSTYLLKNQPDMINRIKQTGLFDDVIEYKEIEIINTKEQLADTKLMEEIERVSKEVDNSIGYSLRSASNIYMMSDFYSIGFFLINNKIKYNYFEDACGILSQPSLPLKMIEKNNINRARITHLLKSFGENECVINRYGSLKHQIEGYKNKKDVDFCVKELLLKLTEEQKELVLNVFTIKKCDIKQGTVNLLLTMHYNDIMSEEEQIRIYSYILDYFTSPNEKLIIKPHPADSITNYENIFPNSIELFRYMPSELFPCYMDEKFEKGLTCWSTAIYGLNDMINNIICFDTNIDNTYEEFDKYYSIVMFLQKNKANELQIIKILDANYLQLVQLLKYHFKEYEKYYEIIQIDDIESLEKNDIVITNKLTTNTSNRAIEINACFKSSQVIELVNNKNGFTNKEYIGIYNFENQTLSFEKEMPYSKYRYSCRILTEDEYLKSISSAIDLINKYKDNLLIQNRTIKKEKLDLEWELEQHKKYTDQLKTDMEGRINYYKNLVDLKEKETLQLKKRINRGFIRRVIRKLRNRRDDSK